MTEVIIIVALLFVSISAFAIYEDKKIKDKIKLEKKKAEGFKPNAIDRDGDGIVQEGTKWERPAPAKKTAAKKPVKKTVAKKTVAKKGKK